MNDQLLGVIIGGAISVAGTFVIGIASLWRYVADGSRKRAADLREAYSVWLAEIETLVRMMGNAIIGFGPIGDQDGRRYLAVTGFKAGDERTFFEHKSRLLLLEPKLV